MFKKLIQDALQMIQENYPSDGFVLASTPESYLFFTSPVHQQPSKQAPSPEKPAAAIEKSSPDSFEDLRSLLKKIAPNFSLHSQPLSNQPKEAPFSVVILISSKEEQAMTFYKNFAKAVHSLLPTKLIDSARFEKEEAWNLFLKNPDLKWLIAEEQTIKKWTKGKPFSGPIHFIPLYPVDDYLKKPALKKDLWENLCRTLRSP